MVNELPLAPSRPSGSLKRLVASPPLRPSATFVYLLWLQVERDDETLPGSAFRPS